VGGWVHEPLDREVPERRTISGDPDPGRRLRSAREEDWCIDYEQVLFRGEPGETGPRICAGGEGHEPWICLVQSRGSAGTAFFIMGVSGLGAFRRGGDVEHVPVEEAPATAGLDQVAKIDRERDGMGHREGLAPVRERQELPWERGPEEPGRRDEDHVSVA
jgi:hypothetical protein